MPSLKKTNFPGDPNLWIDSSTTIFWFRRDLRMDDNAGLYHALKENKNILSLFIFDTEILDKLEDAPTGKAQKSDARVQFIHQTLAHLKYQLEGMGSSLLILYGNPIEIYKKLEPKAVYTNRDYEPYALRRDENVKKSLEGRKIVFKTFKDHVIFEKGEITKDDGFPYTIFTPYSRKWKSRLKPFYYKSYPTKKYTAHFKKCTPLPFPELREIGFLETSLYLPKKMLSLSVIKKYDRNRDFPALRGTSRLSIHLRFGTISIRKLVAVAVKRNEVWLNELIWRDFYSMILWHFPHVADSSFKPAYDRIEWRNNPQEYEAWCEGKTGYPIVDAGMRELNTTGFMHNRARMITASFLTKHLLIDWRWGAAYFEKKLLDFDLASNNGGWQWASGSGCDAAPYFRVFSPERQAEKFDPNKEYIKKWVPEFGSESYPKPIVDHAFARARVLKIYKKALEKFKKR